MEDYWLDEASLHPITRDPAVMGGTPVFAGTRVPAQTLLDYLVAGDGLEEFLAQYPTVSRQQALAALAVMRDALLTAS
jgi:uncharacterized protein (DUF433 family)